VKQVFEGISISSPSISLRLSQARVFGGIGSILAFLSLAPLFIPYAGFVISIIVYMVGLVLIYIALEYISKEVGDGRIRSYAILFVTFELVAIVISVVFVILFTPIFQLLTPTPISILDRQSSAVNLITAIWSLIGFFVLTWVFIVLSAVFVKLCFDLVSKHLGIGLFSTAALLYLIGSALSIILVGIPIAIVASILEIIAFFSIPEKLQTTPK
jgi:uncharacterized membrane protein